MHRLALQPCWLAISLHMGPNDVSLEQALLFAQAGPPRF